MFFNMIFLNDLFVCISLKKNHPAKFFKYHEIEIDCNQQVQYSGEQWGVSLHFKPQSISPLLLGDTLFHVGVISNTNIREQWTIGLLYLDNYIGWASQWSTLHIESIIGYYFLISVPASTQEYPGLLKPQDFLSVQPELRVVPKVR